MPLVGSSVVTLCNMVAMVMLRWSYERFSVATPPPHRYTHIHIWYPDITLCDFFLWDYMNDKVHVPVGCEQMNILAVTISASFTAAARCF